MATAGGPWGILQDTGSQDGNGAISYAGASFTYLVEASIPLGSADAEDIQSSAGALIGIAIFVCDGSLSPSDGFQYPANSFNNASVVTFQLATAPSGIGTSILPFFLLILTFLVVLEIIQKKRSDLLR